MKVLMFDTETTGLISNRTIRINRQPHIIDFYGCIADLKTGKIKEDFDTLIDPGIKIPSKITDITGITDEMVKGKPTFNKVKDRIIKLIKSPEASCVMGHNIRYDAEMVELELSRLGEKVSWPRLICTVEQTVHLTASRFSLERLYSHLFNEPFVDAHRAKPDVHANLRCAVELFKRGIL